MQVILDSHFARPGSAPIKGGKKREFRDWTRSRCVCGEEKANNYQSDKRERENTYILSYFWLRVGLYSVNFSIRTSQPGK